MFRVLFGDVRFGHTTVLLLVLVLFSASLCRAQAPQSQGPQPQTPDLAELSLEELSNVRVYAASKYLQNVNDAPSSITIVTAEEIQEYGYRTVADILESVRGFYITYDRYFSYVGVRGFGRLGDWNSRVLLLIDGNRINDVVLGQALLGTEFPLDVDLIQRVEIVRGPSSSLYGAEAFFAVINVITRKGPELHGPEVSLSTASFGTYEGRASYGSQYKGTEFLLSDTFYSSHGPTLFFPEFDTPATNFGVTSGTDYDRYQHALVTISRGGFTLQGLYSYGDKGVPTAYFGALFNDSRTRNVEENQFLNLSYQHSFGTKWELAAHTSYNRATLDGPVAVAASEPPDDYSFRGQWWDSELTLTRSLFGKHKLTFGSELTDNFQQNQTNVDPGASPSVVSVPYHSTIWALYGQGEFALTRKLSLSAGVRYDHYYSGFGGTTNPRLVLIYHPFASTTAKVLYGSAFRAPVPYEIYPNFGPVYESNLSLQPERIHTVEGIVDQGIGKSLTVSGSVFQNQIRNLITLDTDTSTGLLVYENSGGATATGVELEVSGKMGAGLRGTASYSYTRTKSSSTGDTPANSPESLVKLNLGMPLLRQRLFAAVDGQYTGPVSTLGNNVLGGFSVLNATLTGHILRKHLDLSASLYNALNKRYADPGRPEDPEDEILQDGRTFRVKISYRFGPEINKGN
jgi:outer membrane receptor for ferrienterochelin and colicins